jgi:hypothetical protein
MTSRRGRRAPQQRGVDPLPGLGRGVHLRGADRLDAAVLLAGSVRDAQRLQSRSPGQSASCNLVPPFLIDAKPEGFARSSRPDVPLPSSGLRCPCVASSVLENADPA